MSEGKPPRFVVVGANGPIGANICSELKARGQHVIETSHTPGQHQLGYDFLVDAPQKLNLERGVDYVLILCSGYSNIADCRQNPDISHSLNVAAPQALLAYASNFNVVPVFLSSDNVFDGTRVGYDETAITNPINVYSEQKLTIETFIQMRYERYLILRSSKVLGYDLDYWVVRQLKELTAHNSILCFTDRYYAPLLVNDIPRFLIKAIERKITGIFHLAQDKFTTPFEIMSTLLKELQLPCELAVPGVMSDVKLVEPYPPHTYLLNDKAKQLTGMSFTSMNEFVRELVNRRRVQGLSIIENTKGKT